MVRTANVRKICGRERAVGGSRYTIMMCARGVRWDLPASRGVLLVGVSQAEARPVLAFTVTVTVTSAGLLAHECAQVSLTSRSGGALRPHRLAVAGDGRRVRSRDHRMRARKDQAGAGCAEAAAGVNEAPRAPDGNLLWCPRVTPWTPHVERAGTPRSCARLAAPPLGPDDLTLDAIVGDVSYEEAECGHQQARERRRARVVALEAHEDRRTPGRVCTKGGDEARPARLVRAVLHASDDASERHLTCLTRK